MITRLAILNYQSLQNVTLDLGLITCIVGHSDSGKSALLRALSRACYNDSGYEFITIHDGVQADKTAVAIRTEDAVVVWERTKTTVAYRLIRDGKEERFTKLGRSNVPEEVMKILGIKEVQVDTGNGPLAYQRIQFAGQFELPFLVGDRGGVASARVLGHLTGVHVLANANKKAYTATVAKKQALTFKEGRLGELLKELDLYEGLELKQQILIDAAQKLDQLKVRRSKVANIKRVGQLATNVTAALAKQPFNPVALQYVEDVRLKFVDLWNRISRFEKLSALSKKYLQLKREQLQSPAEVILPEVKRYNERISTLERHQTLIRQYRSLSQQLVSAQNKYETSLQEYNLSVAEAEEFMQKFPLCPFEAKFGEQKGEYRCQDLMRVIRQSESSRE